MRLTSCDPNPCRLIRLMTWCHKQQAIGSTSTDRFALGHKGSTTYCIKLLAVWVRLTSCDQVPHRLRYGWWPGARQQQAISSDMSAMGHKWFAIAHGCFFVRLRSVWWINCDPGPNRRGTADDLAPIGDRPSALPATTGLQWGTDDSPPIQGQSGA